MTNGTVLSLSKSDTHTFKKYKQTKLKLQVGLGVEGDAHNGKTVKHRSRVAKDPSQPNLRQVHLIQHELHEELKTKGFEINAGEMGENITTKDIDLLDLPKDTILKIGERATIQVTGLRNPCHQLDGLQPGLMKAVLDRDADGNLVRKAGIMGIVLESGTIRVGDKIEITLPVKKPFQKLERV